MPHSFPSRTESWSATLLRRDLAARAQAHARLHQSLHEISPGPNPTILFGHDDHGHHGNFHNASYAAICANPAWQRRLAKPHTASRRSRARNDWRWMELDSCNSSDALLMNIFCHPAVFNGQTLAPAVANLLNVDPATQPRFGINPKVPLKTLRKTRAKKPGAPCPDSGTWVLEAATSSSSSTDDQTLTNRTLTDRTEIDLQLGNLFLEAKLTESNFQTAAPRLIERYRDLETVFDLTRLPRKTLTTLPSHLPVEDYSQLEEPTKTLTPPQTPSGATRTVINGYQLIRNVLAAYAADASFCVLSDARRTDLIETWYSVLSAVHHPTFTTRLKLLTWQELATILPNDLQQFLEAKYGISPA
jgi:hypothetical protein